MTRVHRAAGVRRGARAPLAILRLIEDAARGWQQYGLQARGHTRPGRRAASFRATTALSLATWLAGLPLGAAAQTPSVTVTGDVSPLPSPNPLPHWTPGGLLDIGQTGTGALTIAGGGTVSMGSEDVRLGKEVGGIGSVSVTGTGSSLSGSGQLDVGHNGTGSLLIEAGGTVSFDFVTIGNAGGPSHRAAGSVTVKGAGSSLSSGGMYVGAFGDGTLTIQDGGTVSVGSGGGTVWVASYGTHGGTGTVNIGAASGQPAAAVGSLLAAEVAFGAGTGRIVFNHTSTAYTFAPKITGAGALLIEAGVTILTGTNTYSGGTTINGGVLSISRDANLGAVSGGLTLNGGALRTTSSFTSARDVTLSAAGGTIDASGVLTLSGQISGPGSLLVNGPGTLSLTGAHNVIGGAFTLSGSASPTLEIKGGSLTVGDPTGWAMGWNEVSNGLLRVSNGGTLKLVDPMGYLAIKSAMEVSGANSSVTNEGYTDVGGPAAATLTISSGGVMNSKAGALIEGHGTSATVSVTGAGSVWNVEQHMFIGSKWSNGTGALVVSDGGIVNLNGSLYYDSDAGLGLASATVTVTGAGSQLNVVDGLFVGYGCGCGATTAMLTAADGGTVKAGWVEISDTSVLNLGTGGRAGTIDTHAILNDGAIVADFVDTATLAANISGTGTLTKQGTGQLILTGSNSYTGATSVLSGLLTVNGSLTGSTITLAGGALGGSGTVGSVVVGHAGTVAPGNSIGTLNVAGNISFASGSTYQLEVNAAGQSDRIAATGTATLSGGTVQLLAEQGGYGASTRYTILT
ncbi:autotransporter-associated beta strand repeat-containing protein, partial [Bosea sp. 2KB_26]|uniref:beta strand repeat-containing protein n=1 Tax=Bosea sp. 2KB_26 TaxID=3237475 RepID=UPI003F8EFA57